ncbi:MAG: chemotaxis protein CheW [Thermodesulfobacteriota bacterium]|nr:MAG: chemotaxis protein CheW [Thermodesulfobacteriota bacterium]
MDTASVSGPRQYLTFMLEDEVFALEISQVKEILDLTYITKVPRMPEFMRGVINLRGNVVPVLDLRLKLGLSEKDNSKDTCIIIVEVAHEGAQTVIGALADSVREVICLEPAQIEPPPRVGMTVDATIIKGMGKLDQEFVIILDSGRVFTAEKIEATHVMQEALQHGPGEVAVLSV